MQDYYLQKPEALLGQPKRAIADYVEQKGILVPIRFDSLQEARNSQLPILVRSEYPQEDYGGVSGLLQSRDLERFHGTNDPDVIKTRLWTTNADIYIPLH